MPTQTIRWRVCRQGLIASLRRCVAAPLAEYLPPANTWGRVTDLHGKVVGFPMGLAITIVLGTAGSAALSLGQRISARIDHEAAIAREEVIRQRTRDGMRRP